MSEERTKDLEEELDEDEEYITLEFNDGTAVDCFIIGIFDLEDKEYIALAPDDGTDDVYIYGYQDNNDETFELLDLDEEEFNAAVAEFDKIMEDQE